MKTNSIYDDFFAMAEGKPFPFEKWNISWDKNLSEEERSNLIKKQLIKAGLEEDLAIECIARTFNPEQKYF